MDFGKRNSYIFETGTENPEPRNQNPEEIDFLGSGF